MVLIPLSLSSLYFSSLFPLLFSPLLLLFKYLSPRSSLSISLSLTTYTPLTIYPTDFLQVPNIFLLIQIEKVWAVQVETKDEKNNWTANIESAKYRWENSIADVAVQSARFCCGERGGRERVKK